MILYVPEKCLCQQLLVIKRVMMLLNDPVDMLLLCAQFDPTSEDTGKHEFGDLKAHKCKLTVIWQTQGISSAHIDIIKKEADFSWAHELIKLICLGIWDT